MKCIDVCSTAEVQSHLHVALDQGYIQEGGFDALYEQTGKTGMIIWGLIKYLRSTPTPRTKQTSFRFPLFPTEQTEQTEQTRYTEQTK